MFNHTSSYEAPDYFMVQSVAVFARFEGDLLPMQVKDMRIWNIGLYSTLLDLLTCMNESRHVDVNI